MEVFHGFRSGCGKSASPAACAISTIPSFPVEGRPKDVETADGKFSISQIPIVPFFTSPIEFFISNDWNFPFAAELKISTKPSPPSVRGAFVTTQSENRSAKTFSAKSQSSLADSESLHLSKAARILFMN